MSKSRNRLGVLLATILGVGLYSQSAAAAITIVVDRNYPTTCQAASKKTQTIQAAVNMAIAAKQPATILVCPGTYPEQVTITHTPDYGPIITLKPTSTTAGPVTIAAPSTGLVPNYTSAAYGRVAAQFLVYGYAQVTVTNIVIDGSGALCPGTQGADRSAGIMFSNVGDPATSNWEAGTVRFMTVQNLLPTFAAACGPSDGILAENSFITMNDNKIHDVNDIGILEYAGNAQIDRNEITNTLGNGLFAGIYLTGPDGCQDGACAHPVDVSLNNISQTKVYGIALVNGTNNVYVGVNQFSPTVSTGVYLSAAHNNIVNKNTINFPWGGIELDNGSANNLIEYNTINWCNFACILDKASHGGNTLESNKFLSSANYGLWTYFPADDAVYSTFNQGIPVAVCNATDPSAIPLSDVPAWEAINGRSYCAVAP